MNSDSNKNYLIYEETKKETLKSSENQAQSETNTHLSQIDSDLLDYMTDFKLFNDGFVTDWFKTFSFNVAEIREYLTWLENKGQCYIVRDRFSSLNLLEFQKWFLFSDYKRVWTDLFNNAKKKSGFDVCNMEQENLINVFYLLIIFHSHELLNI